MGSRKGRSKSLRAVAYTVVVESRKTITNEARGYVFYAKFVGVESRKDMRANPVHVVLHGWEMLVEESELKPN